MCSDTQEDIETVTEQARQASIRLGQAHALSRILSSITPEDEDVLQYVPTCCEILDKCITEADDLALDVYCKLKHEPKEVLDEMQAKLDEAKARWDAEEAEITGWAADRITEKAKDFDTTIPGWNELDHLGRMMRVHIHDFPEGAGEGGEIVNEARQLAERIDRLIKKPEAATEGQDHD